MQNIIARVMGAGLAVALMAAAAQGAAAQGKASGATHKGASSGLPVPRFVSLKSDRVNMRKGPGTDYPVVWVFSRAGLPVEIIGESEHWRQVRDSEGANGWVFHSLLSGRRTAVVTPWEKENQATFLYARATTGSDVVARLEPGVLGSIGTCDGEWCEFSLESVSGWIRQERLWGVYRGEQLE